MNVIRPNCRIQFSAEDIEFISAILGAQAGNPQTVVGLLADEDARAAILDDESLFRALLDRHGCLRVSTHFYFYVLVRNVFRRSGITDRSVADYVAEVLAEFSRVERTRCVVPGQPNPLNYFFEMLAALQTANDRTSFCIRAHIGTEVKGAPNLRYYEEIGKINFRLARDHRLAHEYDLAEVFNVLSERFETTRLALNDMTDRLLSLGEPDYGITKLLGESN
ncbi:MAG: hypothetical protein DME26_12170 [Verrucomicrobia bacterium]|nr:MAG: hypothetical protein DME26_12170 [Verrucomicrobiota bacterium]